MIERSATVANGLTDYSLNIADKFNVCTKEAVEKADKNAQYIMLGNYSKS